MISIVIPAYNEAGRIGRTVREVLQYADEVIVIDDASTDSTVQEAQSSGARVLRMDRNSGYIAAIKRGFQEARGAIVVTIDADGEFPADRIPFLTEPILQNKADMAQGHRDIIPRWSERVITWLADRKTPVGDSGTGMRALRTDLARNLKLRGACICGIFSLEVVHWGGRIVEIPIQLNRLTKPRRIAWYHVRQIFYLLPWLLARMRTKTCEEKR